MQKAWISGMMENEIHGCAFCAMAVCVHPVWRTSIIENNIDSLGLVCACATAEKMRGDGEGGYGRGLFKKQL